jgi:hypothetical protein
VWVFDLNLNIERFSFCDGSVNEYCMKYLLDMRNFVSEKIPDDGTLVPKHVGDGPDTKGVLWYTVLQLLDFVGLIEICNVVFINPLKTKRNALKTQSVPRSKHPSYT